MAVFEKLFGVNSGEVKENVVLLPYLNKIILDQFGASDFKRGKLYGCANTKELTLVHSGMGATLVGDSVLYLKDTVCENIFLFGSCGSLGHLDRGSLVLPSEALNLESFSEMLCSSSKEIQRYYPDKELSTEFLKMDRRSQIHKVCCATIGSLKLEEEYGKAWREQGVDVVDMEASAFFSAAKSTGARAVGLFYVSDVISKKPFYEDLDSGDSQKIELSIKEAIFLLKQFVKKLR